MLGSISILVIIVFYALITLYGYSIYFDERNNNCKNTTTIDYIYLVIMLMCMWIGNAFLIIAILLIIIAPCIIYGIYQLLRERD